MFMLRYYQWDIPTYLISFILKLSKHEDVHASSKKQKNNRILERGAKYEIRNRKFLC
jgi:hypothetical protein